MRRGDDEFEGGIDINSILNDASLHDELISLGWTDMRPAAKTAAPPLTTNTPNKPTKPVKYAKEETIDIQADEVIVEPLDIGDYGIIDESNLQLTEDDLQDEGLLAEFEYISGGGDSTYEHETDEQHEANIQTVSNGISAITFDSTEPEQWKPVTKPTSKPLENKSSTTAAASSPNATGIPTVEEAKRNAVKFKREGNNAEALKWLRYAKQLEGNTLSTPDIPGTENVISATARSASFQQSGVKATSSAGAKAGQEANAKGQQQTAYEASYSHNSSAKAAMSGDAFAPLESAICEASKAALKEAKACEKSDTKQAVIKMREYKALQQELVVLQSRRQTPGASPALFHWQSTKKEVVVENVEIAEDEVKLIIEGVYDIAGTVETHSSRLISISYLLGISKEETAPTATPQVKYEGGKVVFNYQVVLPVLKRGRHVQQLYARKKATFDVVLHKGFWKGSEVLCQAVLPLSDLITKSRVGGQLPLKTAKDSENGKKGKVIGGQLTAYVVIRSPLGGPEVMVTEERKLVIEPWPAVVPPAATCLVLPPSAAADHTSTCRSATPVVETGNPQYSKEEVTAAATSTNAPTAAPVALTGALATLTEQEKSDPHSVDFIESNDVLEAEIAAAEALLQRGQQLDEDEQFSATMRLQLLRGKLQLLVYQVQTDALSMDQYLEKIKARLKRDQLIALYFKTLGDKESVAEALQVMKRVQTMKKEIQNAEEAAQEEE